MQVIVTSALPCEKLTKAMASLVGLRLCMVCNTGNMKQFHFGEPWQYRNRPVGQVVLHVQCPWRLERDVRTITGSADYYVPADDNTDSDWEAGEPTGHLQDQLLRDVLGLEPGVAQRDGVETSLIVLDAVSSVIGEAAVTMSYGYRLLLFPASSRLEEWRLLKPGDLDSQTEFLSGSGV